MRSDGIILANFSQPFLHEVANQILSNSDLAVLHCGFQHEFDKFNEEIWLDYTEVSNLKYFFSMRPEFLSHNTNFDSDYLMSCFGDFHLILKRFSVGRLSNLLELAYFNYLIDFFSSKLSLVQPQIKAIFFDSTPHMPWDYVLLIVARNLGIKTVFIKRTKLSGYILLSNQLLNKQFYELKMVEPFDEMQIASFLKEEVYWHVNETDKIIIRFLKKIKRFFISINIFVKRLLSDYYNRHIYFNFSKVLYFKLIVRYLYQQLNIYLFLNKYWGLQNFKSEENLLKEISHQDIYVALHYQPERTTLPEAGILADQISAIYRISRSLPTGSRIYVKEHPMQAIIFDLNFKKLPYRSTAFYKILTSIPNVTLLPNFVGSEKIIHKVGIVASATGSVLWEACLGNKSSISFAPTWLDSHGAVLDLSNTTNLSFDLDRLFQLTPKDIQMFSILFLQKISRYLVNSPHNEKTWAKDQDQKQIQSLNLAKAIFFLSA